MPEKGENALTEIETHPKVTKRIAQHNKNCNLAFHGLNKWNIALADLLFKTFELSLRWRLKELT